jgi:transposase-like protein
MAYRGSGAPTRLTPEISDRIVALVRRGSYRETACAAVGVSSRTLRRWLQRARDGGPHSQRYKRFAEAVDRAEAEAESIAAAAIIQAGKEDWRALAWILERRGPQRWNPKHARKAATETQETLADIMASDSDGNDGDDDGAEK